MILDRSIIMKKSILNISISMLLALSLATGAFFGVSDFAFAGEEQILPSDEIVLQSDGPTEPAGDVTEPADVTDPTEETTSPADEPQKTKTKITYVISEHNKSYTKTIKDTIKVTPAYGRTVQLYFREPYSGDWVLKRTYTTANKKTAELTITYPKRWKSYYRSNWKIVCPETETCTGASRSVAINNKVSKSTAAIIMDAQTGEVLYVQKAKKHLKVASLTKMLTMMIVDDNSNSSDKVTITSEAVEARKLSGGMGLRKGDVVYMKSLINASLISSANDAAAAAACGVSGTQEEFAALMREKAAELGATDSTYKYAYGDWHSNTYSTAYDQALIGREFMKNPNYSDLRSIVKKRSYTFTTLKNKKRYICRMGWMSTQLVRNDSFIGIKSGYNSPARNCYAGAWKYNGKTYISVVLGASSNSKLVSSQKSLRKLGKYLIKHNGIRVTFD